MNIKSVTGPIIPHEIKKLERRAQDTSADRDANSQSETDRQQHKMSKEDVELALEFLRNLKGVKENNLQVRLDQHDGITVVYIEDLSGRVIRRIPESDLWSLTKDRDPDKKKGALFDRAG